MRNRCDLVGPQILELDHRADNRLQFLGLRRRKRDAVRMRANRAVVVVFAGRVEGVALRRVFPIGAPGSRRAVDSRETDRRLIQEPDGDRLMAEVQSGKRLDELWTWRHELW